VSARWNGVLGYLEENIIEITLVYAGLLEKGEIAVNDSLDAKWEICRLANQFDEFYKNVDWNESDLDYYEEVERFAKEKLLEQFPRSNSSEMSK